MFPLTTSSRPQTAWTIPICYSSANCSTIPVCGLEAIATESPTVTPVPTLALVTGGSDTEISIADVLNVGDLSVEQALIVTTGADAIVLAGWALSDESELVYTFGDVTIFGEGAGITVHSGLGKTTFRAVLEIDDTGMAIRRNGHLA